MNAIKMSGVLALLVSTAAVAAAPLPADKNGDGMVSLSEYQQAAAEIAAKRFARLDTNGDGQLTPDELQAARRPGRRPPLERFKKIDTDGDGSLSLAELQAVHPNMTAEQFNRLDRNSDGLIEPGELRGGHRFSGAR